MAGVPASLDREARHRLEQRSGYAAALATKRQLSNESLTRQDRSRRLARSTERQEPVKDPAAPPTRANDRRGLQRSVRQLLGDYAGKLVVDLDVKL